MRAIRIPRGCDERRNETSVAFVGVRCADRFMSPDSPLDRLRTALPDLPPRLGEGWSLKSIEENRILVTRNGEDVALTL